MAGTSGWKTVGPSAEDDGLGPDVRKTTAPGEHPENGGRRLGVQVRANESKRLI